MKGGLIPKGRGRRPWANNPSHCWLTIQAIEGERWYILGRRRIATKLAKQKQAIEDLLKEVQSNPDMPEQKLARKPKEKYLAQPEAYK